MTQHLGMAKGSRFTRDLHCVLIMDGILGRKGLILILCSRFWHVTAVQLDVPKCVDTQ
jgi:hypothetical protein